MGAVPALSYSEAQVAEGWTEEKIAQVHRLENEILCACPKENFTRVLAGCPDSCADQQKIDLREWVRSGVEAAEIKRRMVHEYGNRVLGDPPEVAPYLIPFLLLGICAVVGFFALLLWRRGARSQPARTQFAPTDSELARIERELEELD